MVKSPQQKWLNGGLGDKLGAKNPIGSPKGRRPSKNTFWGLIPFPPKEEKGP